MPSIDPGIELALRAERINSRPVVHAVARGLTAVSRAVCIAAALIGFLLPLPVLYEVVMDQLHDPPIWVFETTGYAIIIIAFAASGYGLSIPAIISASLCCRTGFLCWPGRSRCLSAVLQIGFGLVLARCRHSAGIHGLRPGAEVRYAAGGSAIHSPAGVPDRRLRHHASGYRPSAGAAHREARSMLLAGDAGIILVVIAMFTLMAVGVPIFIAIGMAAVGGLWHRLRPATGHGGFHLVPLAKPQQL